MAAAVVDTGLGATVAFTGIVGLLQEVDLGEQTIEMLDSSYLGTTGFVEKVVGDLVDGGTVTVTMLFNTSSTPITTGTNATLTATFPTRTGESAAATYAGTATLTSQTFPTLIRNELQRQTLTFDLDGQTGPTYTVSTVS